MSFMMAGVRSRKISPLAFIAAALSVAGVGLVATISFVILSELRRDASVRGFTVALAESNFDTAGNYLSIAHSEPFLGELLEYRPDRAQLASSLYASLRLLHNGQTERAVAAFYAAKGDSLSGEPVNLDAAEMAINSLDERLKERSEIESSLAAADAQKTRFREQYEMFASEFGAFLGVKAAPVSPELRESFYVQGYLGGLPKLEGVPEDVKDQFELRDLLAERGAKVAVQGVDAAEEYNERLSSFRQTSASLLEEARALDDLDDKVAVGMAAVDQKIAPLRLRAQELLSSVLLDLSPHSLRTLLTAKILK